MKKQRLLITGASGFLGSSLAYALREKFDVLGLNHTHPAPAWIKTERADLTHPGECKRVVQKFKPDICIHCAAMANIDRCEAEHEAAYLANVEATRFLTDALRGQRSKLVYVSTDAVYGGEGGNFTEDGTVRPLNYYAETKLQAESEAARCSDALIVRTSFFGWSIGQGKISTAEWVFNELSAARRIRGFTDVITASIYTFAFAELLERALAKDLAGVFNFTSSDSMSKDKLARTIARLFGLDAGLIEPVSIDQFPLKARRSKNLSLSSKKLSQSLGVQMPTVEQGLERFYRDRGLRSTLS
jgi:dTDP-4-dehydrorhamnose reductase